MSPSIEFLDLNKKAQPRLAVPPTKDASRVGEAQY